MPSKREERSYGKDEQCRAQPNQKLPKGHFNSDGLSQGRTGGAVRPSEDAYQGPRDKREESK